MGIWMLCSHRGVTGLEFCILWIERRRPELPVQKWGLKELTRLCLIRNAQEGILALLCRNKDSQESLENPQSHFLVL